MLAVKEYYVGRYTKDGVGNFMYAVTNVDSIPKTANPDQLFLKIAALDKRQAQIEYILEEANFKNYNKNK